jgi:hypothetical protein
VKVNVSFRVGLFGVSTRNATVTPIRATSLSLWRRFTMVCQAARFAAPALRHRADGMKSCALCPNQSSFDRGSQMCIDFSVGRNAANRADDVKTVQILLNMNLYRLVPFRPVPETGSLDATTLAAIDAFFKKVMSENDAFRGAPFRVPSRTDGNIEPNSDALSELRDGAEAGLTAAGLQLIFIHAGTTSVRTFHEPMCSCMTNYGVRSPLEVAHFLAQVGHECMELRYTEEIASGAAYEGRTDLGNTQPGDGVRFKGPRPDTANWPLQL